MTADNVVDGIIEPIKHVFNVFLDVFWKILSFPFIAWNKLPQSVHHGCLIFLVLLGFIILIYLYINKHEIYQIDP